jgi:RNA polymerase sigma factor (sigma-70 family)
MLAPKMLAVCMRYAKDKDEAQDIMQEGFIKMFKNMKNYRGEGSLEGWIRRIMVHSAISRYRKAKTMVLVDDFAEQNIQVSSSRNGNNLEARELMKWCRNCLPPIALFLTCMLLRVILTRRSAANWVYLNYYRALHCTVHVLS